MSIKHLGFFVLVIGFLVIGKSNKPSENVIYWSDDRELTWGDFQGDPDYNYGEIIKIIISK